jgi:hypothetical protein
MTRLRIGPIAQIAMALALMACMLVLVASALLKVFAGGDDADERTRARRALAESIALYGAGLVQRGEVDALQTLLRVVVGREPRIEASLLYPAERAISFVAPAALTTNTQLYRDELKRRPA